MTILNCTNFELVLAKIKTYIKNEVLIQKIVYAYEYAKIKHLGQTRKNGDPYLYHLLSTTYNLSLWHAGPVSLQAGLLHDVLEDTPTTTEELKEKFGEEVTNLVVAVTKVSHFAKEKRQEIKAAYLRKLYLSLAHDIRVIIIKMADRLHNIRTIKFLPTEKQLTIAKETLEVYSSIAHRLGMRELKQELEDRSFAILYPKEYKKINSLINKNLTRRQQLVNNAIKVMTDILHMQNMRQFRIYGRSKSCYSIYRKMYHFGKNFEDINDLLAIRVICNSIDDCYAILGYFHQRFLPVANRFKDYIATPKNNMYQSLHTCIIYKNEIYEVQIRTEEMEIIAEVGAAAHWRYKEGEEDVSAKKKQAEIDEKLNIFQIIFDLNSEENNDLETDIKQDLFSELIYVLTPNGKVITLPRGATVLDFAYKIHTEVGEKTVGAKINGVYTSLNTILKTGDIVAVKTNKKAHPNYNWLTIAKTNFARYKIKKYLIKTESKRDDEPKQKINEQINKINTVKEKLEKYITENNLRWKIASNNILMNRLKYLKYSNYEDFCLAIANGAYTIEDAINNVLVSDAQQFKNLEAKKLNISNQVKNEVVIQQGLEIKTQLAHCCLPIPDEAIVGYITKGQGIKIHRTLCPNVINEKRQERTIPVHWNLNAVHNRTYSSAIKIYYFDRPGLLTDVLNILNQLHIQIQIVDANNKFINKKGILKIVIKIPNIDKLQQVITSIKKTPNILDVARIIM